MNKIKQTLSITFAILMFSGCGTPKDMAAFYNKTLNAASIQECEKNNGYWYNNKCWANFKDIDKNFSISEIDTEVDTQIAEAKNYSITVNNKVYPIYMFFPEMSEEEAYLITVYKDESGAKTLLIVTDSDNLEKNNFMANTVLLIDGDLMEMDDAEQENIEKYTLATGKLTGSMINKEKMNYKFSGSLKGADKTATYLISLKVAETISGMGATTLTIKGNEAYLNGTLGTQGYAQFRDLIKNNPEVKTIVLQQVPGSVNDAVNMHTGRIIREAGLTTKVLSDSKISSGGVDLFCAGKKRIVEQGAKLGIHSWGGDGISADQLAKDHPAHQYQIAYFTMCLGKEKGEKFYFKTLNSASAGEMYWMTNQEIKDWTVATKFKE